MRITIKLKGMSDKQIKPYPLRLEPEIRKQLERIAKDNGRSLNTEIAMRLKQSLAEDDAEKITEEEVRKIAREIYKELSERSEI